MVWPEHVPNSNQTYLKIFLTEIVSGSFPIPPRDTDGHIVSQLQCDQAEN